MTSERFRLADPPGDRKRSPLAMPVDRFRTLGLRALDMAARHMEDMPESPVHRPLSDETRHVLATSALAEHGMADDGILDFFANHVMPFPLGNAHPRFFAWITSAPAPIGILADMLAATMNANCGAGDHAAAKLEETVNRWLMNLVGFPTQGSYGLLVSGGSMANLTALAVARQWAAKRCGFDVRESGVPTERGLIVYQSEETHSCVRKAVELLGLGGRNLRTIPVDQDLRMRTDLLAAAIAADRAAGLVPFCVVATSGTVNSGAIDPLEAIADICNENGLWFHVDGAYGGLAAADPDLRDVMTPIARAHSVALDPHKWLCVPIECGAVLVREAAIQHATFSLHAPYLRGEETPEIHGNPWPFEFGVQLSRAPRAIKTAAVLMSLGQTGVAETIARHRALARELAGWIEAAEDLELTAPVPLSLVCFRYAPPGQSLNDDALDRLNQQIADAVNARGRAFFTPTTIHGRLSLRASIIHYDVTVDDLEVLLGEIRTVAAELAPLLSKPVSA